jgi:hypothetical protein
MSQTFSYDNFVKLLQQNEHELLDFKVKSDAFVDKGATAELVKDIIAMANNGYRRSYLVIGVSDNKKGFLSVENMKLNELNIQNLCKDSIFPVPRVKVFDQVWNHKDVAPEHQNKRFVIIQIGPNHRQCFRFNKDYIDWEKRYHFRKNEVWVRRGSSSDTAQPEEIKRLLEGEDYQEKEAFEDNVNYTELLKDKVLETLREDFAELVVEKGGTLEIIPFRREDLAKVAKIRLPIGSKEIHLIAVFVEEEGKPFTNRIYYEMADKEKLPFHHGYLIISTATSTKSYLKMLAPELHLKKSWGNFIVPGALTYLSYLARLGKMKKPSEVGPFILDVPKIKTRENLTKNFIELYAFLSNREESSHAWMLANRLEKLVNIE